MTKHLMTLTLVLLSFTCAVAHPGKDRQIEKVTLEASQGYRDINGDPVRGFDLVFGARKHETMTLSFELGGKKWTDHFVPGEAGDSIYHGTFPAGLMEEAATLKAKLNGDEFLFQVPAAREWTVWFLPHSHQDIGYTHRQADVMRLQWRNLEHAIELAEKTKDYPEESRYRWNTEATWSIAGYLDEYAGKPEAERLLKAIRNGSIGVDACLGSILSGISRQEELMHYFDDAHRIEAMTGVDLNTAMCSDVPGHVWGLATALSLNGVRYFSPAPNYVPFYGRIGNDRAAAMHVRIGDHPFWWSSQAGTDKVLVWEAGRGYSWFHGWLAGSLSVCGVEPIFEYLSQLESEEFPYNMCYLRYTIHGDNGPPDDEMPDVINDWNKKWFSPRFRIATTKEFFLTFEKEYGDVIPTYGGDMTPTWEDGAASTAKETAMNRRSSARLAQSQILWSMLKGIQDYPSSLFFNGYKNAILFSEHTWGASASGHEPDSQFTIDLWEGKKMYADSADIYSKEALNEALNGLEGAGRQVHVINTDLWPRTDVVRLEWSPDLDGKALKDAEGRIIPWQRRPDGSLIFLAERVPAMSSAVYSLVKRPKKEEILPSMVQGRTVLDNGLVRIEVNPESGTISSFRKNGDDFEYASEGGLNDYLYTGRVGANPQGTGAVRNISVLEDGPVAATLRIVSDAPGCVSLTRDICLYRGSDKVIILNSLDKEDIRDFENVRFVFPFNFPHPDISMDLAMSEVHPERDQMPGVNKHYYSLQNGLTVGDLEHGICLTSVDAPFVELGSPSGEDYRLNPRWGYGWWPTAQLSAKVYSWVMTNTWRTNYKASQGGETSFSYTLQAVLPFQSGLKKRGFEEERKMIAVRSDEASPITPLFTLKGRGEVALSALFPSQDGSGYIVRLQNLWNQPLETGFLWGRIHGARAFRLSGRGEPTAIDPEHFWMQPYEYMEINIQLL